MSTTELDRFTVSERVCERRLSQADAAKQLGLTPRHVSRLVNVFERNGVAALVSKRRGCRSNHAYADAVKVWVHGLVREHYADFSPTLLAEKLAEKHELVLSRETLRLWLMEAGLRQSRKQRDKAVHQPRNRRECLGELFQIDASEHAWFVPAGRSARSWSTSTTRLAG
ncbi:helix-turn-helix domain-containing protein [Lamprobacter modestohalophilus]|uniref:helix-turn-helix domain-containing protein n=1 Tax=Lamprobacter modestohalophilus TaxID=1064514 RepID=UPI002ADEB6AC|nr:helix-turn-helix domain-containing protein [Lamprobacter modestohalophilus]MEA1053531.1 helix-turn-helix domain-containing protein [Lamprobacter modestohalophilus]